MEAAPTPPPTPSTPSSHDKDAFEAFATCDFASASKLALAELRQFQQSSRLESPLSPSRRVGGVPLPALPGASKATVALTEACSREDKLAAVALQCGLELRREEEARAVGAYYTQASHGRVPFPVAMIWLQILLSQGTQARFEEAKQTLLALRQAMEASGLPWRAEEKEEGGDGGEEEEDGATTEGSGATAEESETVPTAATIAEVPATGNGGVEDAAVRRMYAQATELLVLRVLLPQGEGPRAVALLQQEQEGSEEEGAVGPVPLLEAGHRHRLLEACRSDARRRAARGSSGGGGLGGFSSSSKSDGAKRRAVASTAAAGYGRQQHQQQLQARRFEQQQPPPPAQYAISRGRLTPSAIAAARARAPSASWGSSLGSWLGGGQQGRYERARRLLLAVLGFCVLALGFHGRRGGRSDGPFRLIRAALAAVVGRAALGSSSSSSL